MDDSTFNRSPWSIREERFKCFNSTYQIRNTLDFLRKKHQLLSVQNEDDSFSTKSVLLKIEHNTFQIDKPIDWQHTPKKFKIFFRDQHNTWNFIKAELSEEGIYQLSLFIPQKMFRLESRWHKRVTVPSDAKVKFYYKDQPCENLQIINLSASGMLVCSGTESDRGRTNSTVNEIVIDIPDNSKNTLSTNIDQGVIVRSFENENSGNICHGISFVHKNKDSLRDLYKILS